MDTLVRPTEEQILPDEVVRDGMEASRELEALLQPQKIVDESGFERTEYSLGDGVTVVFRGREELPEFPDDEQHTTVVVGANNRPLHTSGDDFGTWATQQTQGDLWGDPFERAMEHESGEVRFIGAANPLGVVQTAIELAKTGVINSAGGAEQLTRLEEKVRDRKIDDDVIKLYDQIYAACSVKLQDGEPVTDRFYGTDWANPNEDGLVEVTLALLGDERAQKVIEAKLALVHGLDKVAKKVDKIADGRAEEDTDYREPGEKLTEEELKLLEDGRFIGVHTTPVAPYEIGKGISLIRSTAEFNNGKPGAFPRPSMHFSLNHAVESHIMGNFDKRPYTVISPLHAMAKLNGAPAVLYGVDTYFTAQPGEGLFLPEETCIVELADEGEGPLYERQGNKFIVRSNSLTAANAQGMIKQIAADFSEAYTRAPEYNSDPEFDAFMRESRVKDQLIDSIMTDSPLSGLLSSIRTLEELKTTGESSMVQGEAGKEYYDSLLDFYNLAQELNPDMDFDEYERANLAIRKTLQALFETDGLLEAHPKIHDMFTEGMRRFIVNRIIVAQGGKVVKSDGMSAYIEDEEFSHALYDAAKKIGVRSGLHQYNNESHFEQAFGQALGAATESDYIPAKPGEEPSYERMRKNFDWTKYDASQIWRVLQSAPWAVRRHAIDSGILTVAPKKASRKDRFISD